MRLYALQKKEGQKGGFLYEQLIQFLKEDILRGTLSAGERLPSKRQFATQLGISIATVEKAYSELVDEGYLYAKPKSGYYVHTLNLLPHLHPVTTMREDARRKAPRAAEASAWRFDLTSNELPAASFPFSTWSKVLRQTIAEKKSALMTPAPMAGTPALRRAIAAHLADFRGLAVTPDQIVIGAGSEYLYALLTRFFGKNTLFALEDPSYGKMRRIYESCEARTCTIPLDESGICIADLRASGAAIAHTSPSHHFPTGLIMPVTRRYELLAWASETPDRYILEDDYDSEFRFTGRPLPTLMSIDAGSRVIYLNTFTKTLTPTIRISYLVLPPGLIEPFQKKLGFLACPVSTFEQYTLAQFIQEGYFEKHLSRMRTLYRRKRDLFVRCLKKSALKNAAHIIEPSAGLHFLLQIRSGQSEDELKRAFQAARLRIHAISDYYAHPQRDAIPTFLINYSSLERVQIPEAVALLVQAASN
ncbi:MAG: PLP-dependent aminotransferase family protein [Selenomonadaceae bacterium]|nr:PLP-dependent aminotransferase family protein [Selenomonadaceae bacterium]